MRKQIQIIKDKTELAIEDIKLEEAQKEYRERKNANKLIEELESTIKNKRRAVNVRKG